MPLEPPVTSARHSFAHGQITSSPRIPPPTRRGDGPQPGPGDVGDRRVPGQVGVGAGPDGLGGVHADAAAGAAVGDVLQGDRVARRAGAGEEVEHHDVVRHRLQQPPHQAGRLRRLEDVADDRLELRDRGVGRADLLRQPDRPQLLAPAARAVAVQPVLLEHVDPLAVAALDHAADQVVGRARSIRGADHRHTAGRAVTEHRLDLDGAVERAWPPRGPTPGRRTPGSAGCAR